MSDSELIPKCPTILVCDTCQCDCSPIQGQEKDEKETEIEIKKTDEKPVSRFSRYRSIVSYSAVAIISFTAGLVVGGWRNPMKK